MRCLRQLTLAALLTGCGDGGGFVDAAANPPLRSGTFALAWTLTDATSQPVTCAQANATFVSLEFADVATGATSSSRFACNLGLAVTGALFVATYNVEIQLTGDAGTIATATAQTASIVADMTTKLAPVAFVTPM
jgi:hypothetical protein